jgi:predicted nucleotidyltransferase
MKLGTIQDRQKSLNDELGRIITVILNEYDPEKVVLFGSLVSETIHEWSDIDLLVIKKTGKRPIERIMELTHLIRPQVGIDLFIYTPEEIELLLKECYPFLLNILKTGKTMYEKRS